MCIHTNVNTEILVGFCTIVSKKEEIEEKGLTCHTQLDEKNNNNNNKIKSTK